MSEPAASFDGSGRFRVYLPALMLFVGAAPGGCPGCHFNLDLSGLEAMQAAWDIHSASQLHMLGRLVAGPGEKKLQEFGRAHATSGLSQAREAFDKAVGDAERDLRQKWPGTGAKVRMLSESLALAMYDDDLAMAMDFSDDEHLDLDNEHLYEFLQSISQAYPDIANDLPDAESLRMRVVKNENGLGSPDAAIALVTHFQMASTDQRPPGEFASAEQLERARLRTDPFRATFRIVYEMMADTSDRRKPPREPVVTMEVVTLVFEYRGERWELVRDKQDDQEANK
jgi:hypothetical protein